MVPCMYGAVTVSLIDRNFGILFSILTSSMTNTGRISPCSILVEVSCGAIANVVCVSGSEDRGWTVFGSCVDSVARDAVDFVESVRWTGPNLSYCCTPGELERLLFRFLVMLFRWIRNGRGVRVLLRVRILLCVFWLRWWLCRLLLLCRVRWWLMGLILVLVSLFWLRLLCRILLCRSVIRLRFIVVGRVT